MGLVRTLRLVDAIGQIIEVRRPHGRSLLNGIDAQFWQQRVADALQGVEQQIGVVAGKEPECSRTELDDSPFIAGDVVCKKNNGPAGNGAKQDAIGIFRLATNIEGTQVNVSVR